MKTHFYTSASAFLFTFNWRQALCIIAIFILSALCAKAQKTPCKCSVLSFTALTVYDVAQSGTNVGFGVEAGKWNNTASRFSYFFGTKLQWLTQPVNNQKYAGSVGDATHFTLYVKGQWRVVNKLYVVLSPGIINLNSFETGAGLRYTFPLGKVVGIGLEPGYLFVQKQFSLNTNIHFCLK